jgi:hypothetical protein
MAEQLDPSTGLPLDVIKNASVFPDAKDGIDPSTGLPVNVIQQSNKTVSKPSPVGLGFAGSISQNLTNVYTDPLSNYKDYDVNTNAFAKDWNEQRAQNQPWYQQLGFGLTKAVGTIGTSVVDGTLGFANGVGSMLFDKDHSYADNTVGNSMDAINDQLREWLPNYYTKEEQESLLGAVSNPFNFIGDKVAGGAAYTVGMLATMYLTGGMGAGGGALAGARALGNAAKVGANVSKLAANYRVIKGLQAGADISKIVGGAANVQRLANGARALDVAITMGLAEASVEARETKKQFIEEREAEWEAQNPGMEMPEEMRAGIEESALAAMNTNFLANMAVLTVSNAVTFGGMAFKAARGSQVAEDALETSYKITKNTTTGTAKYAEGLSNYKLLKAIQKGDRIFGQGVRVAGTEAFQEGAQFATNIAAQEYYGNKFNNNIEGGFGDMMSALLKGGAETFTSKDGLESMLIGAIIGGGTAAIQSRGQSGVKAKNTAEALKIMNSGVFQNMVENFENTQENIALLATISKEESTDIEKEKARRQLIHNHMRKYDKVNALDYANEELDDLAALDETDFKKRMGYDEVRPLRDQTGGKTQQEVIQDIKDSAKRTFQLEKDINTIAPLRPPQGIFAALQSEEAKKDFLLQQKVDREYRQLLFSSALQSEVATEEANKAYQTLIALNPEFAKLDKNKLFYSVSLGDVFVDAQGEVQINSKLSGKLELDAQAKKDAKFEEQLDLAIEAFRNLSATDQTKYAIAINNLQESLGVKSAADVAFNELRKNPDKRQFYVEAQRLLKGQKKQQIADEAAEQAIKNALTPEELEAGVPANASPELIIKAKNRYKELKKQVKEAQKEFTKMNYNELSQLDADEIESTNPVRAQALRDEMQEREIKRKLDEHNETRAAIIPYMAAQDDADAIAFQEAQQEAVENFVDVLDQITSDIVVVDSNGRQFVIQGRTYEVKQNPLDSLEFDENFNITTVVLTDTKTGREKRFNVNIDYSNVEEVREARTTEAQSIEDLIPEAIAHSILMNAMAIDEVNNTVDSALTTTEDTRVTILSEALDAIEKEKAKKTNTDLNDSDKSIGTLKTERRRLKMINNKLLSMLDALDKAKNSERLSQDEFEAIPKIKDIIDTLTALGEVIDAKSSVIESKQLGGDVTEPDFSTNEEQDNILVQEEQDAIATLTNQLNTFAEAQQANQDILEAAANNPGYLGFTETDLANMRMEAGRLKTQVNELRAKIESHRENINIIKQLQDEVRIAELQQAGEAALGSGVPTQGQVAQGEDTSINTGTPQERPDQSEEIRAEEEKRKAQAAQEELDKIKNTTDSTELKSEPTKPVPAQAQPQTEPAAPVVTVSSNTLNLPLAQIEVQKPDVESSQVIVSEDGSILSGNMVVQMDANNNPILIFSENISDPNNTVKIGDDVEFVVDETTKWWQENKDKYPVDEHWMQVPIFVRHNGVNIALLAGTTDKNQTDRKLIFDNKNGKPTATVKGKLISDSNISNAVTETGTKVFYDPTQLIQQGGIGIVTTQGVQPFFGEFTEEELVAISQIQSDNLLKGQVIIIGKDPLGRPKAFVASTKSMDEYGLTAILNSIKEGAFENVSQILGTNLILDEFIAAEQESYDDIKNNNIKDIVYLEVLGSGELLFTFYSESAKSLIRISASNIQNALNSENDSNVEFSFVDFKQSEKEGVEGYDVVISERKDHKSFKKEIMNEFRTAVLKKKYQVSKDLLSQEGKYVSKITGIEYNSYVDYLASSQEFSEPREEGLGHNSILSTDIALSASGSAFNNIGLDLGNLRIQDQIVPTATQVERNAVKISEPTETTPEAGEIDVASTPADDLFAEFGVEETTPTTPVSTNAKRQEVRAAIQKAGQGEGGQFFVTLVNGTREAAVRISLVGNELGIGNKGVTVDLSTIIKIENPDGTILYDSKPTVSTDANIKTPIEGLNERLDQYGSAKVVLPSNFYEGARPIGRLNAFKAAITKVAENLITLADVNFNEFDFLGETDRKRLDALRPIAEELRKINTNDISSADRRTVAVEKRYAALTNQLANEFVDIIGKHVEQQLSKKITSSKFTTALVSTDAKADIEKTLYGTISGSIPLSEALPNGIYIDLGNGLFAYTDKNNKIAAIVDRVNGYVVSKSFWNQKQNKWQLPNEANLKDDAKKLGVDEVTYIKKYQDAVNTLNTLEGGQQPTTKPISTDAKADIERRRLEDSKKPSKDSVFYNLIERLSKGSVTLSSLIENLGSKLKSPIKTNTGEITGISFNQVESRFSFTHKGMKLVGYFTDGKWEIGKLNEKGNYNYISYDEIADINKKYGSQKEFLQSINKELVSDIENFEKLKYTKEESSSDIIPLENSISKKADELRIKYGNAYLLQDFLKQYDAELAALESGKEEPTTQSVSQPAVLSFEEKLLSGARQSTITPEQQQILEAEMRQQQGSITNLADMIEEGKNVKKMCD